MSLPNQRLTDAVPAKTQVWHHQACSYQPGPGMLARSPPTYSLRYLVPRCTGAAPLGDRKSTFVGSETGGSNGGHQQIPRPAGNRTYHPRAIERRGVRWDGEWRVDPLILDTASLIVCRAPLRCVSKARSDLICPRACFHVFFFLFPAAGFSRIPRPAPLQNCACERDSRDKGPPTRTRLRSRLRRMGTRGKCSEHPFWDLR
ncbi:hypothetical protein QBC47DRAFT_110681 [Echria macrotheca]|uniref:Uncharacterized protein n=1 Tax=Echria macrotheca TaxID=438768 RepID=A0AAJ0BJR6_9PEZI|nr:hypothetical protein QBC47DRAFT_110681 [Echria macrotheca]